MQVQQTARNSIKLGLFTNRKSHTLPPSVGPKISDLEWPWRA